MASLMENLIVVLKEECEVYEGLFTITQEKTQVIVADDLNRLQEITNVEQDTVTKIQNLEKKRTEIVNDIAMVLGKNQQHLTITEIIQCLNKQPEDQKQLSQLHDRLSTVVHQLVELNEHNQRLVKEALDMVEFNMNVLRSTTMAPQTGAYNKGAYNNDSEQGSGMFDTSR